MLLRFLFYFLETLSSRSLFTFYEASFYEPRKTSVSSSFDGNHRHGSRYKKIYLSFWNKFILVEKIALKKKNTWYLDNSGAGNFSLCLFFFFPFLSFFHSTILQQDLKVKVPSAIEGHRLIPTAYRTTRDKHRVHSSRSSFGQVCTKGGETCEEGGARAFERKLTWTK